MVIIIDHVKKCLAKLFDLVSKQDMCKILMVTLLLASTSCTQVVTIPVRTLFDMPSKVERVRTTSIHDLTQDSVKTSNLD